MFQEEYSVRQEICEIGRRMYERQLVAANDGNISARLSDGRIVCTPTGVSKGFMTPEMLCVVNENGETLDKGSLAGPSSEMKMHLRVYKKRSDINAVVHAHPVYATTFAVCGMPLDKPVLAEAIEQFGTVPLAPYGALSTEAVPDSIEPFLKDYSAVLLEFHGALTWGTNLMKAYMKMESLEFYAQILYRTKEMGSERELSKAQVDELFEIKRRLGIE